MLQKNKYTLSKCIEIRFADPISCVKLLDNYVVVGTMMGRIFLHPLNTESIITLSELNSENISDMSYNNTNNKLYIGVGDDEVKVYKLDNLVNNSSIQNDSISVYDKEYEHTSNCENAFIFLSPESLFRIQLFQIEEETLKIEKHESPYELKLFDEEKSLSGEYKNTLPITNYTIPFDFDGEKFLYIEFLSSKNRNICVSNIPLLVSDNPYKKDLNKDIGHICQAKLLPNNRVFFVHSLNKCEIRACDEDFTLLEKFEHIGEEVLAIDIYFNEEKIKNNLIEKEEIILHKNIKYNNKLKEEMSTRRILITSNNDKKEEIKIDEEKKNNYLIINQNTKQEKEISIDDMNIITLDIDGNVNLYKDRKERTLFNMYDLSTISQEHKDKSFFSMGYAYYIKGNSDFICITSDHGCYVIKINIDI